MQKEAIAKGFSLGKGSTYMRGWICDKDDNLRLATSCTAKTLEAYFNKTMHRLHSLIVCIFM